MVELVVCLMGPTASGKTAVAYELVQKFPFEIISVDSAMIYRGMDIGTAKPNAQMLIEAPHHLIDILDPPEHYSAAQFCEDVHKLCKIIHKRGNIPLLVGGTMMYFRALQQGLSTLPQADGQIRKQILQQAEEQGWLSLHGQLAKADPDAAARIHPNDSQRIQRALEVYQLTGKPLSEFFLAETNAVPPFRFINLLLMPKQRQWLHQRIALRFEQMLSEGLIDEVNFLIQQWNLTASYPSMRSVGYRQVLSFLQGEYDYSQLKSKGIAATRQLAKRQLTWLRHWPDGFIFSAEDPALAGEIMAIIGKILDNN
ncbi:tRNA (adenosine(37)-N6)-dimethylallyltransferase MiaA [Legionella oakridgensis]|uniref:tRNA (adenosine(37)-N6)-dimethylallyltransferase MiaA n=1 Tax=Legionella oakridgensis TaxID=29423 RepID=UPI0003DDFCF9|nr:tRNA (adenosine(37)-N6)-dimethylallyltransferase MiaA [Legionella oakridgensis]ETO92292.1 tRNA dimethylallyltransferase [Legionella oakridgensis RV-2-2007]